MVSNAIPAVFGSNSNSEPCAITARIAPSTSPCARSWPCTACAYSVSSTRRAASQPSREPAMVMWLPRDRRRRRAAVRSAPGSGRRGRPGRGSGAVVVEVDDDLRLGRNLHVAANLRLGASEGESDALFGKGSGSSGHLGFMGEWGEGWSRGEVAEQAVTLEALDLTGSTCPMMSGEAITCAGCR